MVEMIRLRVESCKICEKNVVLAFDKVELRPDATGLCQIIDLHGVNYESKPHVRLLYVDPSGSVRSFTVITNIAKHVDG